MASREHARVREIALALPEVNERLSHGQPCFFIRNRRPICYFHEDHNGDGRISIWCPALADVREELVLTDPSHFFEPPTSESGVFSHWVGTYLNLAGKDRVDWVDISALLEDAYRQVAPKSLLAVLDGKSLSAHPMSTA